MNKTSAGGGVVAPGPCPDLETLARFVDAELTAAERTRVVEHLADCESCAERVAETVQLLGEVGLDGDADTEDDEAGEADPAPALIPPGRLLPFRRWVAVAVPLAAAATLAVVLWPVGFGGKSWVGEEMARRALGEPGWPGGQEGGIARLRGSTEVDRHSLRMGVIAVDLAAAIAAGDAEKAAEFADEARLELREPIWGDAESAQGYEDLAERLRAGEPPARVVAQAAALEERARKALAAEEEFSLGAWAEAGRLAAVVGNAAYFADPRTLRQTKRLARADLPGDLVERVSRIADRLAAGNANLAELEGEFRGLIRAGSQ